MTSFVDWTTLFINYLKLLSFKPQKAHQHSLNEVAMNKINQNFQIAIASLVGLITLTIVQIMALFAKVEPHPPDFVGPFLGAVAALGLICLVLVYGRNRVGIAISIFFSVLNIPNVGLHKLWIHPAANVLWPIIILGSVLIVTLFVFSIILWKKERLDSNQLELA